MLTDGKNTLDLKSIGFIVKTASTPNLGEAYPFALNFTNKVFLINF